MPALMNIHETVLYATDLAAAMSFYQDVLGLSQIGEMSGRGLVFRVTDSAVLLIFDPTKTVIPGAGVPTHGATGAGHMAFTIPSGTLSDWRAHLAAKNIPIEMEVAWPRGGHSLYIRDPANNSIEFIAGRVWPE
jgi:catechol-2,3-dioxygenase